MQMSGFFMLHLYVDPEGESYEKLYGITPHAGRSRPEAYLKLDIDSYIDIKMHRNINVYTFSFF